MNRTHWFQSVVGTLAVSFLLVTMANGQAFDTMPNRGFYPLGSYSSSDIESVNNVTGNVTLTIPLAKLPAGRAGSTFGVSLIYNSAIYDMTPTLVSASTVKLQYTASTVGGWRYGFQYGLGYEDRPIASSSTVCDNYFLYKAYITMPDGSRRDLRLQKWTLNGVDTIYQDSYPTDNVGTMVGVGDIFSPVSPTGSTTTATCSGTNGAPNIAGSSTVKLVYMTLDSSFIRVEVVPNVQAPQDPTWTIHLPNGTTVSGGGVQNNSNSAQAGGSAYIQYSNFPFFTGTAQTITDRNGNGIHILPSCSSGGPCTTTITDDLAGTFPTRQIVITYGPTEDTISWPGPPQGGGPTTLNATINHSTNTPSQTSYSCDYGGGGTGSCPNNLVLQTVSSVVLPLAKVNGPQLQYSFSNYTNWGELHSVTLPSGATISYSYWWDTNSRPAGAVINPIASKTNSYSATSSLDISSMSLTTTFNWVTGISSTITAPDGSRFAYYFAPNNSTNNPAAIGTCSPNQPFGLICNASTPQGQVQYVYSANPPFKTPSTLFPNPYVSIKDDYDTANDHFAEKRMTPDQNGNVVTLQESDWATAGTLTPPALRTTSNTYWAPTNAVGTVSDSSNGYWNTVAPAYFGTIQSSALSDNATGTLVAATQYDYDNVTTTVNLRHRYSWDSTLAAYPGPPSSSLTLSGANSSVAALTYTTSGTIATAVDPNQNTTAVTYDSNNLYPTQVVVAQGKPEHRTASFIYDGPSGFVTSTTDVDNGVQTSYTYDLIGRQIIVEQVGGGVDRMTNTTYDDVNLIVAVAQDRTSTNDQALKTTTNYDRFGRVFMAVDAAGNTVRKGYSQTPHNCSASPCAVSYKLTSNPYATTGDLSMGWTLASTALINPNSGVANNTYTIQHFAGSSYPAPFGSNPATDGASATDTGMMQSTIDEAGYTHSYTTNGLGQLSSADGVTYLYDVLGNLKSAGGRSFNYSSLSRPLSATNLESQTVSYSYDANGNLVSETDGRGAITCFGTLSGSCTGNYDGLNRPSRKSYSDGTYVTYSYDQDTKGTLYSVASSAGNSTTYTHDKVGRIIGSTQVTVGAIGSPYSFVYDYNLADFLTSEQYPSTRWITYTPDSANRISSIADTSRSTPYANSFQYSASGLVTQMTLGNGLTEGVDVNPRLQISAIAVCSSSSCTRSGGQLQPTSSNPLTLQFGYNYSGGNPSGNNGNVRSQTISPFGSSILQSYGYICPGTSCTASTSTNQLKTVGEASWSQTFSYDGNGNRSVTTTPGYSSSNQYPPNFIQSPFTPISSSNFNTTNNQINVSSPTPQFDSAGNEKSLGAYSFTYDAESRLTASTLNNPVTYVYDGEGQRVMKIVCPSSTSSCTTSTTGATLTAYVYDALGSLIAEYSTTPPPAPCTTCYVTVDHLGSTRMLTDSSGNVQRRYDYLPFGEEIPADSTVRNSPGYQASPDSQSIKFTGQFRDPETGFDFMNARYYSPAQGRFVSPDPENAGMDLTDPQTLNGYSYVTNNPLSVFDPFGLQGVSVGSTGSSDGGSWDWNSTGPFASLSGPGVYSVGPPGQPLPQLNPDQIALGMVLGTGDILIDTIKSGGPLGWLIGDALEKGIGSSFKAKDRQQSFGKVIAGGVAMIVTPEFEVEGLAAKITVESAPKTLFHYTNAEGLAGILESGELRPSLKALNPNDVFYGNGQYLSDIVPGSKTPGELSRAFLGLPWQGRRFTHYIEVDVTGLKVVGGRPGVFVVPSETPLNLTGRIIKHGVH